MAREITSGFAEKLDSRMLKPVLLMKGEFASGTLRFFTGLGVIMFNGEQYNGSGTLVKMTRTEETQALKANNVTFQLNGISSEILSVVLNDDSQGRPVTAWLGLLDDDYVLRTDFYQTFRGYIDVPSFEDTGETCTVSIACESEIINFLEAEERKFTAEDQKRDYPDDKGLDFVATLVDIELPFGAGRTD